jgi:cell division protease FtsH
MKNYSEDIAAKIDNDVKDIIDSSYNKILNVLTENVSKLDAVANAMLEKEKIEGDEFEELFMNS